MSASEKCAIERGERLQRRGDLPFAVLHAYFGKLMKHWYMFTAPAERSADNIQF